MLDLMRDIILATDLAHHLRIFKDLQKMAEGDTPILGVGVVVGTQATKARQDLDVPKVLVVVVVGGAPSPPPQPLPHSPPGSGLRPQEQAAPQPAALPAHDLLRPLRPDQGLEDHQEDCGECHAVGLTPPPLPHPPRMPPHRPPRGTHMVPQALGTSLGTSGILPHGDHPCQDHVPTQRRAILPQPWGGVWRAGGVGWGGGVTPGMPPPHTDNLSLAGADLQGVLLPG